jgi:L-serine/L-threonine ammonia-lyase
MLALPWSALNVPTRRAGDGGGAATTTQRAKALIRMEGADSDRAPARRRRQCAGVVSMLTPSDAFIHPFDDPLLWQGHANGR